MDFVLNNILLIAVVLTSGTMFIWQTVQAGGGKQVSPSDATRLMNQEDALVIDVRSPSEFATGHIAGSLNIPREEVKERLPELEKHKERTLILNCASGARASSACSDLRKAGFAKVVTLAGGIGAWTQAGLPVKKGSK